MPTASQSSAGNVIPADQPSIFKALQKLQTSVDPANQSTYGAIVRPNNPPPGIGGYLFDIPGDEEVRLTSSISRHYVEANTPISDHIALDPERVTVRGLVFELTSGLPPQAPVTPPPNPLLNQGILSTGAATFGQLQGLIATIQAAPGPLVASVIPLSLLQALATAQQAAAAGLPIDPTVLTTLNQLSNYVGTNPGQIPPTPNANGALASQQSLYQYFVAKEGPALSNLTRQAGAALFFQQAWWGRQLFSVETPWGIWTNMAIADVRMLQAKSSRYMSDFAVIFERIRVAGDLTINSGNLAGRNAAQQSPLTQNGTSVGGPLPTPVPSFVPQ